MLLFAEPRAIVPGAAWRSLRGPDVAPHSSVAVCDAGRYGAAVRAISAETTIRAPATAVWDLYADVPGSAGWVPFVEQVLWVRGEPGIGQRYRERTRLLGLRDEGEWEIVEWDPPRRQVQRSTDKGIDSHLVIEVEPLGSGRSRVRQSVRLRSRLPPPIAWYHEAVFALVGGHGIRGALAAARRRLESASASNA